MSAKVVLTFDRPVHPHIRIQFDGLPSGERQPRLVDIVDAYGISVGVGRWVRTESGGYELVLEGAIFERDPEA